VKTENYKAKYDHMCITFKNRTPVEISAFRWNIVPLSSGLKALCSSETLVPKWEIHTALQSRKSNVNTQGHTCLHSLVLNRCNPKRFGGKTLRILTSVWDGNEWSVSGKDLLT
jgi:hypothetical protein